MNKGFEFYVSFFEIYGGRLYDLLNNKNKLQVLDDKNGKVQIFGLVEKIANTPDDMRLIIDMANSIRTTHNTVTNETSSRSHAICNIVIKEEGSEEEYGKLSLVDLAGSERAQETQSNDRMRRAEGAEIY
jgi:kinesin family member 2/24